MKETIIFLFKSILKYGILLFGVSWFLALASRILFDRSEKPIEGKIEWASGIYKESFYMGIRILAWGAILSLIPFK